MKTSAILVEARQYLIDHGWIQGRLYAASGAVCALGATFFACPTNPYQRETAQDCLSMICKDIGRWNDEPGRTIENVLALFDEAVSMALSEEAVAA
jgi:hypothetical protein